MTVELILPGLVAVVCGVTAGCVPWPVRSALAIRVLAAITAAVAAMTTVVLAAVVVAFSARWAPVSSCSSRRTGPVGRGPGLLLQSVVCRWAGHRPPPACLEPDRPMVSPSFDYS